MTITEGTADDGSPDRTVWIGGEVADVESPIPAPVYGTAAGAKSPKPAANPLGDAPPAGAPNPLGAAGKPGAGNPLAAD